MSSTAPACDPVTADGNGSTAIQKRTRLAARAKAKVKASARGWSMLSQEEILALAWFADLFLNDAELAQPAPARTEPPVISHV